MWQLILWIVAIVLAVIFAGWVFTHTAEIGQLLDLAMQRVTEGLGGGA